MSGEKAKWCIDLINEALNGEIDIEQTQNQFVLDLYIVAGVAYERQKSAGWISVDERLPDEYKDCLCALDNGDVAIQYFGYFDDGCDVWVSSSGHKITHWQPLPPAPTK